MDGDHANHNSMEVGASDDLITEAGECDNMITEAGECDNICFHKIWIAECERLKVHQTVIIRVYLGPELGVSAVPFEAALHAFKTDSDEAKLRKSDDRMFKTYTIQTLNLNQLRNRRTKDGKRWGPWDLAAWLKEAHAHGISTHIHQGAYTSYSPIRIYFLPAIRLIVAFVL